MAFRAVAQGLRTKELRHVRAQPFPTFPGGQGLQVLQGDAFRETSLDHSQSAVDRAEIPPSASVQELEVFEGLGSPFRFALPSLRTVPRQRDRGCFCLSLCLSLSLWGSALRAVCYRGASRIFEDHEKAFVDQRAQSTRDDVDRPSQSEGEFFVVSVDVTVRVFARKQPQHRC